MNYKFIIISVFSLLSVFIYSGCKNIEKDKTNYPKEFNMAVSTSTEEPDIVARRMEPLRLYLEKELNMPVKYFLSEGYAPVIEAMKAKKIDMSLESPYPYLLARKKANARVLFYLGRCDGKTLFDYKSCILTLKSSGIKSMEDIKAKCHVLKLAFVDPASSSGHIVPGYHFIQEGINPEKDFKSVIYTSNHLSAVFNLHAGKVDIACVEVSVVNRVHSKYKQITPDEFNYIWISGKIPELVYAVRNDLNPDFIRKVLYAFENVKKDSSAWQSLKINNKIRFTVTSTPFDSLCYLPADEKTYDDFEKMVQEMPDIAIK